MISRRAFTLALPALAAARSLLAAAGAQKSVLGICAFSCHQHWRAVTAKHGAVQFTDALTFYRYARDLGAQGVQVPLKNTPPKDLRAAVEKDNAYYEADLRLPKTANDLAAFESDVRLAKEAGATVARTIFTGLRRYEAFKNLDQFRAFTADARKSLELAEPIARKHQLKLAVENHKDHTIDELVRILKRLDSPWIGALVDTGNNIALLDDPHAAIEALAPFAMSVHFKDMAVKPYAEGFLLSEVPLGQGFLDLARIIKTLRAAHPAIAFNLEMATRDPLKIPCLTDIYFATFPDRRATHLDPAMALVKANLPKAEPPSVKDKPLRQILNEEEANNRASLAWMSKSI